MNQFVAPTSFITSISRRRANIAMRIVLRMSRPAAANRNRAVPRMTVELSFDKRSIWRTVSYANSTVYTPGASLELLAERVDELGVLDRRLHPERGRHVATRARSTAAPGRRGTSP